MFYRLLTSTPSLWYDLAWWPHLLLRHLWYPYTCDSLELMLMHP